MNDMFLNQVIGKGETITVTLSHPEEIVWPFNNTFVTTGTTVTKQTIYPEKVEEKETAMSLEQNQIDYLSRRVDEVYRDLRSPLTEKFNLYKDNAPRTYKELIDAIKNDKFKLNEKRIKLFDTEDDDGGLFFPFGPFDGIIWDGPQPDKKGFAAALDSLHKARIRALDIIKTSPAADGLKALQEFDKWTPEGAAN